MRYTLILTLLLTIVLCAATGCGGDKSETTPSMETNAEVQEPSEEEFMKTSLKAITSQRILEVAIAKNNIKISYEQITDDTQAILVQRWLDLAVVAMSFMEQPQTITIIPVVEGESVAEVTIEAKDVASLLTGDMSLQETLSKIKIAKPR